MGCVPPTPVTTPYCARITAEHGALPLWTKGDDGLQVTEVGISRRIPGDERRAAGRDLRQARPTWTDPRSDVVCQADAVGDGRVRPPTQDEGGAPGDRAVAGPVAVLRGVLQLLVHRDLRAAVRLAGRVPDAADDRTRPQPAGRTGAGAPRNLARRPNATARAWEIRLRWPSGWRNDFCGWRKTIRQRGDTTEVSAEKGYLREFGNLVFHFSPARPVGRRRRRQALRLRGQRHRHRRRRPGFCSGVPGRVRQSSAPATPSTAPRCIRCLRVNDFQAHYLPNGQDPVRGDIDYQVGDDLATGAWRPYRLEVNHPRGSAGTASTCRGTVRRPTFTVTFPTASSAVRPCSGGLTNPQTLLSSGVVDRPRLARTRRR